MCPTDANVPVKRACPGRVSKRATPETTSKPVRYPEVVTKTPRTLNQARHRPHDTRSVARRYRFRHRHRARVRSSDGVNVNPASKEFP